MPSYYSAKRTYERAKTAYCDAKHSYVRAKATDCDAIHTNCDAKQTDGCAKPYYDNRKWTNEQETLIF
jgi:hypothetical protein